MADERSRCCFIIGGGERAEKRAGEGPVHKWGPLCLACRPGEPAGPPLTGTPRCRGAPSALAPRPPWARVRLRGWRVTEVPDIVTGRQERDILLLMVPLAIFIIGAEAFNRGMMFCHREKVTP